MTQIGRHILQVAFTRNLSGMEVVHPALKGYRIYRDESPLGIGDAMILLEEPALPATANEMKQQADRDRDAQQAGIWQLLDFLREQEGVPEAWRPFGLLFTGTTLISCDSFTHFPGARYCDDTRVWNMGFLRRDHACLPHHRIVRIMLPNAKAGDDTRMRFHY